MWTSKRVLLLLFCFVLFTASFLVYAYYLGSIDGLPPLPPDLGQPGNSCSPGILPPPPKSDVLLRMAFGESEELKKMPIKLEVNTKNLVIATKEFVPLDDGRVQLTPFYLAIFGKDKKDGKYPEINTIKADVCYLTFDRPVSNITEMGSRKIISSELCRNIYIKNNRKTPSQDDDLSMTTQGPLFYEEARNVIWTEAPVRLLDTQSKPEPTTITARGMDVMLTKEQPPANPPPGQPPAQPAPSKDKNKKQAVSGVDMICLRENVEMHLIDSGSGFMGNDKKKPADKPKADKEAAAPKDTAEPAKIVIMTAGPFHYDVPHEHAWFDIPAKRGPLAEKVTVTRLSAAQGQEKHDLLICEHLDIHFQRGSEGSNDESEHSMNLTIQDAHAIGKEVTLDSEGEGVHAIGNDFFHNAQTHTNILKGTPEMVALKDGHEIHTPELHMVNAYDKEPQRVLAKGKGYVALLDKNTAKRSQYAFWDETAYFTKEEDKEKGVTYDCLTLTGRGRFEDRATPHPQILGADKLKVWLMPSDNDPAKPDAATESQKMRPHHLEGTGHVFSDSEDLILRDTDHLIVHFRDVPPKPAPEATSLNEMPFSPFSQDPLAPSLTKPVPAPAITQSAPAPWDEPQSASKPLQAPALTPSPAVTVPQPLQNVEVSRDPIPLPSNTVSGKPAPEPPVKRPMRMTARDVETYVVRCGEKNDLEKIRCVGDVKVLQDPQDPTDPNDKGVDIRGNTLNLDQAPEGGILVVTGEMAQVQLNKITICGDEVNINQRTNQAWVPGRGWMKMLSSASLSEPGAAPKPVADSQKEPEKEITIHWLTDMIFDGRHAVYQGNVQAEQENSRLLCKMMQVFLDKEVSLKGGQQSSGGPPKTGESAKVKTLVCDKSVRMDELLQDKDGELIRRTRLLLPETDVDNESGIMTAPGPGVVTIQQYGSSSDNVGVAGPASTPGAPANRPPTAPAPEAAKKDEKPVLKLTRINYLDNMHVNNIKHTATFLGSVEVVNLPTEDFETVVDLEHPPKGCMYIRCEQLKVFNRPLPDGRTSQEMEAIRHVVVESKEFWGAADKMKYDESKDLVILEGGDGGKATIYRERNIGGGSDKITGKRIYYWRRTNQFKIDEGGPLILQ